MPLYKNPGSEIWWVSISVPGHKRVRESTGETSRSAAQRIHDERKAAIWKIPPALTGKTWGNAVLKWVEASPRSSAEIASILYFGQHFPDCKLADITPETVDAALRKFCKTAANYTRHRARVSAILKMSDVDIKLVTRKAGKTKERDWLTHEQWAKLRAELPTHMRAMADFAIATGLRQSNVLNLRWDHVDIKRKVVWVEAINAKGKNAIGVPLSVEAINVLNSVQGTHPEFVFTYNGRPVSEIKTAWASANIRAGTGCMVAGKYRGFTWHGMRHTWATWHVQNGTPLDVLQKLGGWASYSMVLRYAHHAPGYLAGFADNTTKDREDGDE